NVNSFVESIVDVCYTAPSFYTQEIKDLNGVEVKAEDILDRVMPFLNVNIYNPIVFDDQILLPNKKNLFKYYQFEYMGSTDSLGYQIHQIEIIPKRQSQQLVSGYFHIVDNMWIISKIDLKGRIELSDFYIQTEFGLPSENFLLPIKSSLTFHLNLLGNEVINTYHALFQYESVKLNDWREKEKILSYDLSDYFNAARDSLPIIRDSLFWNKKRPIPLSDHEETLYEAQLRIQHEADSIANENSGKRTWNYSRGIFFSQKLHYNNTQLIYSGLINPLKFSYSKIDGVVYWQQFRLTKDFKNGQIFQFRPDIGFLLQKDEIYFNVPAEWIFAPAKFGSLNVSVGNSNQSFNSKTLEKINEIIPDSINFDDFNIDYFRHYRLEVKSSYELTNGLLMYGGVDYNWYMPVNGENSKFHLKAGMDEDLQDLVSDQYRAFSPVVGLRWTPGQYYRFNGTRKEYLNSKFPTVSAEYARGIKGIFRSNSDYERIEVDIQQKIPLGLMQSLHYYIGAGWFTNTRSIYFADFKKFRKRNIPESWNDPIGGIFHLLRGDWYNAANSYYQAHFMYESPFFLLQLFKGITIRDVLQERIYVSQLYTPVLPSYTEIGYGVGNFLGNMGIFFSLNKWKFDSVGFKIAFDLR
ncbi:MAG: DUF5686 family protein, partial [Bacteroidales bacterium]|nr:DUF5686 family protein [Bacteroidales bacterium]